MSRAAECGLHVLWTKPWEGRGSPKDDAPLPTPIERFVLAASALLWRWHSGPCKLYTDLRGEALLRQYDMLDLWSEIDTGALENPPAGIDASVFWDLGKTLALRDHGAPASLLDLDLIAWSPPPRLAPVMFYHWEENEAPWYVTREAYAIPDFYQFDPRWNFAAPSCNTAYVRIESAEFLEAFCREGCRYAIENHAAAGQALPAFLFSGQRLFGLVASSLGIAHAPLLPYVHSVRGIPQYLSEDFRPPFESWSLERRLTATHLWSKKHELRRDGNAASAYAAALVRIAHEIDGGIGREIEAYRRKLMPDPADQPPSRQAATGGT